MKWLRQWFRTRELPPAQREAELPEPIDWRQIEDILLRLAEQQVGRLAERTRGEVFYGIGFDCSAESGELLICANTNAHLAKVAAETLKRSSQYYVGKTVPDVEEDLRWQFGEWKYHGFNLNDPSWSEEWADVENTITNATNLLVCNRKWPELAATKEAFMQMASRALMRLKSTRPTLALERASGFAVLCAEHNEGPDEGFRRMSSLDAT